MKKLLVLGMVLAAAAAAASCNLFSSGDKATPESAPSSAGLSPPKEKKTWIYFTKNHGKDMGSPYDTDCVGIVGTDRVGTQRGDKVTWQVRQNNGGNDDDKCEGLDMATVNLRFQTDVMGAAAMKKLTANPGGVIQGTVSMEDDDIGAVLDHKYWVYIGDKMAGPDPVIIVGCSSCGPPPTP